MSPIESKSARATNHHEAIEALIHSLSPFEGWDLRLSLAPHDEIRTVPGGQVIALKTTDRLLGHLVAEPSPSSSSPSSSPPNERSLTAFATLIARHLDQARQLHERVAELRAVSQISSALTGLTDLQDIMECALRIMIDVMDVDAGAIRLLKPDSNELVVRSWVNLSNRYFEKGPVFAHDSELDIRALAGEVVYVEDISHDERVRYPELVEAEGIRSFLCTGLVFRNRPVGAIRLYTRHIKRFDDFQMTLLHVTAQQIATAIVNASLFEEQRISRKVKRQLKLASSVQQQMLPQKMPEVSGLDLAARCLPSLELGGDFYDFIEFGPQLGIALGDVVGKDVPAALFMASVRASLRAHAIDVHDLSEVMARTNRALYHDTEAHQFATAWYGLIDIKTLRLTYTNAGHNPGLIFRLNGDPPCAEVAVELGSSGMALGIDPEQIYEHHEVQLLPGDTMVIYSDGLTDAMNFDRDQFGMERTISAVNDIISANPDAPAADVLNHILWQARRFIGFNDQFDDITLVVARVCG